MAGQLYDAAKRLSDDPTDMTADAALSEASVAVFALDYIPGMDEDHLAAVGRVTRRLLGALGADEALEDDIRHQAEVLCRLIAPSAGETQEAEQEARALARLEVGAAEKGRIVALPQSDVTPGGEMGAADLSAADLSTGEGEATAEAASPVNAAPDGDGAGSGALTLEADQDQLDGDQLAAVDLSEAGAGDVEEEAVAVEEDAVAVEADVDEFADEEFEDEEGDEVEDSGELVYELAEWLPEQRVELSMLLESAGIPYNWDASDLTVAEEHEDEVDGLFEQVHGAVDEDDEARYHSIEELFGAVGRLANDPGDEDRQRALLETVGVVELPTPVGVDDGYWWRVRSQGHALVAAIEHGSRKDEISREAALLAEMLHEMV